MSHTCSVPRVINGWRYMAEVSNVLRDYFGHQRQCGKTDFVEIEYVGNSLFLYITSSNSSKNSATFRLLKEVVLTRVVHKPN